MFLLYYSMQLLDLCPDIFETIIDHLFKARARINLELYKTIVNHYKFTRRFQNRAVWDQNANEHMFIPYWPRSYYNEPQYQLIHWRLPRKSLIKVLEDNNLTDGVIVAKCNRKFLCRYLINNNVCWGKFWPIFEDLRTIFLQKFHFLRLNF